MELAALKVLNAFECHFVPSKSMRRWVCGLNHHISPKEEELHSRLKQAQDTSEALMRHLLC